MNLKEVRELIELVSEKGIAEFELERQGFRIRICRARTPEQAVQYAQAAPLLVQSSAPVHQEPAQAVASTGVAVAPAEPAKVDEPLNILTSPIVGTFYRSASPESDPFVEIGSRVQKGQVLCIIEAMKLMNEIESDVDGVVAEIYPQNAQAVEYGQPLFAFRIS
jgi:acetyl-CoA carboxylase biotin carboxyl carrier protein